MGFNSGFKGLSFLETSWTTTLTTSRNSPVHSNLLYLPSFPLTWNSRNGLHQHYVVYIQQPSTALKGKGEKRTTTKNLPPFPANTHTAPNHHISTSTPRSHTKFHQHCLSIRVISCRIVVCECSGSATEYRRIPSHQEVHIAISNAPHERERYFNP